MIIKTKSNKLSAKQTVWDIHLVTKR